MIYVAANNVHFCYRWNMMQLLVFKDGEEEEVEGLFNSSVKYIKVIAS